MQEAFKLTEGHSPYFSERVLQQFAREEWKQGVDSEHVNASAVLGQDQLHLVEPSFDERSERDPDCLQHLIYEEFSVQYNSSVDESERLCVEQRT